MKRSRWVVCAALALAGCAPPKTNFKAIIGATLIDGSGRPPVADAVIVIAGSRIRGAGPRPYVPVPQGAVKINGAGKFVTPGLIDLSGAPAVNAYTVYGVTYARGALGPGFPHIAPAADLGRLLEAKPAALLGTVSGAALVRRIAGAGVVIVPRLAGLADTPEALRIAQRDTKMLAEAGVRIAAASSSAPGVQIHQEIGLLVKAGLSPMEALLAATRNGAIALGKASELGTIEAGKRADLLVLSADPLADVGNLGRIERVMVNGEWVKAGAAAKERTWNRNRSL